MGFGSGGSSADAIFSTDVVLSPRYIVGWNGSELGPLRIAKSEVALLVADL